MLLEDRIRQREMALRSVENKFGIDEFMMWFIDKYSFFDETQLKMALDAWCESKSREAMRSYYAEGNQRSVS